MIPVPGHTRVWPAAGFTDMRQVSTVWRRRCRRFSLRTLIPGICSFLGRRGDLIKVVWWDGQGACLFAKRLERGRFVWPLPADGKVAITAAQLAMRLEGIGWLAPQRTWRPLTAG